ncbi:Helicase conserved C-terminal domain-containing protein [Actinacidiphila yanglinensis]|uniref:Helicase conserved C-terminal domain-containing protein n=1 Tax=Actinacidiphila yanglinensis TaxID=310779 RepID=A0A1H6CY85_9ACTN|nr:Helicase conserved C-terminal domain-containing protein [Actinacidiphila yanglinensis]
MAPAPSQAAAPDNECAGPIMAVRYPRFDRPRAELTHGRRHTLPLVIIGFTAGSALRRRDGQDGGVTLIDQLPSEADPDALFEAFSTWAEGQGISLYPAQEEALIEVVSGANVILSTPTGSGKSLVAAGAHFAALARDEVTFYTAPIKALVSEKFFDLCKMFGTENVGMLTGDASVNPDAPVICCTAEVLASIALRDGRNADVGQVVMDEFHFYAEPDRGWAWQIPLLELPQAQFVLMSATLGDVARFEEDLTRRTGRPTAVVRSATRPVPLSYEYRTTPMTETLTELLETRQSPVYIVHFTQAAAVERAQALMSINMCTRAEKDAIADLIGNFRFTTAFGRNLSRYVRHGIGVHHAGMLPKYRRLVEKLAQAGLLKVICGTDTLGVGVNVPIRTVLFTALTKYDGQRVRVLRAREFHQIAGRAGRAGFDTAGFVVAQAPEYVIENEKALAKAGDDPKKRRKVVRKKAPEGFVGWGQNTFEKLIASEPEALTSRFRVTHAMLLSVIARPGNAFDAMRRLLEDNHEDRRSQLRHIRRALAIYRSLLDGGVVERLDEPDSEGRIVRLTVDLQQDFALNQPLSTFALAAFELLDPDSPSYALDMVSVVESTLDDPRQILAAQQNKARGEAIGQMKADGVEYEERMERIQEVTYPKPLEELLLHAYGVYRKSHPWVGDHPLSPKSVIRDMYERAMTFSEFVSHYELARTEGIVLRYLAGAFKALDHTVPDDLKSEDFQDLTAWLGELVRQVDSSLLDEWEQLANPETETAEEAAERADQVKPVTANARAFRVLVRNALFRRVELAALEKYEQLGELDADSGWDGDAWADAMDAYWEEYDDLGTGPDARGPKLLLIEEQPEHGLWRVRQTFADPNGDHGWGISAEVDLAASDEEERAVVRITDVGEL